MCGIVGYVGDDDTAPILLDGLRRLEYRGYDSAGVAIHSNGEIKIARAVGKLRNLEKALEEKPLAGTTGIGHTRWATHGRPTEVNAHPHQSGPIALVHNGIIENHLSLRTRLVERGAKIVSDTDTEIAAHLVHEKLRENGKGLEDAVRSALREIHGAYALAVLSKDEPGRIVVAKASSPLVIGIADDASYAGSDIPALLPYTRKMIFLEDGDMAVLEKGSVRITRLDGTVVERAIKVIDWSPVMAEKAGFKHFMLKEIHEQPRAIEDTLRGRLDREHGDVHGHEIGLSDDDARSIKRVFLLACGTSHHAAMTGRYYLESIARIPTSVELASEFRGREPMIGEGDLVVAVSQSGETIDTLIAAREAKERGAKILAIANVIGSAIPRMADAAFYTHAGPEIGVASTKCFSTQLANLMMLSIWLGKRRGTLDEAKARDLVEAMARLPLLMRDVIQGTRQLVCNLAKRYRDARDVLFLGRGLNYPIALEAALKLKEISYVHAEGYAAGEMKHGPIALIDSAVPVFVLMPKDRWYERTHGNLQEAKAREGQVIAVATEGDESAHSLSQDVIEVPDVPEAITPFLTVLPMQLYSYYVADFKGTDVDQPRNLAKTVTVE
ncbi:glutamine--fructose-6-phosphate transaminase (isomerizing) [Sandaracinus amylolyticus]|uniref:glutamine--fructose-6-phosphate transaminase (isomerizing) n=1 Tax=Sandaracinus amylolyticus TaxID=927083 RepID=UPI001F01E159|nr:glutamine--fructose-6-phosphate transaminase (isomerizing) [Sandaracinus amylolyticus]UJR79241.1 Glucosamine--fructose-6-phosphate aminotransferase [Sandaracinus amylolyticus]